VIAGLNGVIARQIQVRELVADRRHDLVSPVMDLVAKIDRADTPQGRECGLLGEAVRQAREYLAALLLGRL
jgi:hypothetical protein